jgi:hypothetical protein
MNYRKLMLVAFVLLAILTLGAVSASGDADNLAAAGGDDFDIGTPLDDEILSLENTAVAVGNSTTGGDVDDITDPDDGDGDGDDNETDYGEGNFTGDDGSEEYDENVTDDDEMYALFNGDKIYTDTEDEIVSVWVPQGYEGTVSVYANGIRADWDIEFDDINEYGYHQWGLKDLNITQAGDYLIIVEYDEEIINNITITVYEFNNDEFRAVYNDDDEIVSLYCPEGSEGTLRIIAVKEYDDDMETVCNKSFDIADFTGWSDWNLWEYGLARDGFWRTITLGIYSNDEVVFEYEKRMKYDVDDDDDPYHIEMVDSFDISDRDAQLIKIYCPEGTEGYFVIIIDDEDEIFLKCPYEIKESDYDNDIYFTASDLNINEPRLYKIYIYLTNDPKNLEVGQIFESYSGLEAIDYSQFRVIEMDTFQPNALFKNSIFAVYCPDGSEGNITVTVREGDDEEPFHTSVKPISDKNDENQLYWNLSELNMDKKGEYFINIYVGEDELQRGMRVEVVSPIYFEEVSIINSSDNGRLAYVEIPSDISDANITLIINDEEIFTKALDEFVEGSDEAPYWDYMRGSGWTNTEYKRYFIENYHIGYDFSEDAYQMTINLAIAGRDMISESVEVRLYNRNVVSNENLSIEVFGNQRYYLDNDWNEVVLIKAYAYCGGNIVITVADNDWIFEYPLDQLDSKNDEGDFQIYPCAFNGLGPGDYEITVAYFEGEDKILETSAFVTFYNDDEDDEERIYLNIWDALDERGTLYLDACDGDIVHVDVPPYFGGNIIVYVDDEERVNWEIDYENDGDWTYNEWNLNDLGITEAGNYSIKVTHNDETLRESTMYVVEWDENSFRVDINYEDRDIKFILYYPEGTSANATVRIDRDDEGDMEFIDELFYEITPEDSTNPFVWSVRDLELENDRSYHFHVAVFDGEDEIISYGKWFYWNNPEIHSGIWNSEDERGTLYTDAEGDVLNVDIPPAFEGNIIVRVNGEEIDNWEIETDDEDGWAYKDWGVEELGISKAGSYAIELIYDNGEEAQTLINETISVSEFKNETFRAMIQYTTETIRLYVPDGVEGTVTIITEKEIEGDELEKINEETYEITPEDYGNWKVWSLEDLGFEADGAFRIFTLTVTNVAGDEVYCYKISHVDGENENNPDWYHEEIEFGFITLDDDGYMEFNKTSDVLVAYLYIPDNEDYEDVVGTVYVELNGELIKTIKTDEFDKETLEIENHYPVVLDLSGLNDKDMLTFTIEAFHKNGESAITDEDEEDYVRIIIVEDKTTYFIGHDDYDPERLEYTVFFGNLTTKDTNDPDLMGTNFNGNFVIITISNARNITEGTITVSDGETELFSKQLSECDKEYDYGSVGYQYSIALEEVIDKLPENKDLVVTFHYPGHSLIQKRFRESDYLYTIVLPEDIQNQFHFNVIGDFLRHESDNAIFLWTETNRQAIYFDLGGGYFIVYVNGTKVENLGRISYDTWKNEGIWRNDDWDYLDNWAPDEDGFLEHVASYWGSELELFRLTSWTQGAPDINITLADLGITESGTYNIRIVHFPSIPGGLDDHSSLNYSDFAYAGESLSPTYTEFFNENITCNFDPDYAGVDILKERVYKNGQPFLFTFQFGDNVLSESNRILVYLNNKLAFNSTTLFWEENDDGVMELVELWELNDGQLNEYSLNEYGVLDVGEYEAVVYLVKGDDDPVEIGRGNFTVMNKKGNMNFEMKSSSQDDGLHTVLYADISEGNWDEYSLSINIADSEEFYPDEDDWFSRWYDEYVIFKDDEIYFKDSLDKIIGKGPVAIDLGVLDEGTHIWVVYGNGEETVFNGGDFYQYDFKVNNTVEEPSEISLSNDITFDYNQTGSANVSLVGAKNITAFVIGHDEAKVTFNDGVISVSGLDAGNYILNVTTVPEEGFTASSALVNITVNKIDANLTVEVNDVTVGETTTITVFGWGIVNVRVDGITYTINCTGVGSLAIVKDAGTYGVNVIFEGDKNINPAQVNATFTVAKLTPTIVITQGEAIEGSDLDVTVEIANATGIVAINGVNITLKDGKASTTIKDVAAGDLDIAAVYFGDAKYVKANATKKVTVKAKENPNLIANVENINVGETAIVNIEINANVTGKVTVDGNEVIIDNGKGTYSISNLTAGTYTVAIAFAGDKYFNAANITKTFEVSKVAAPEIVIDVESSVVEGSNLTVEVTVAGATGTVNINGADVALKDGKASTTIKNVTVGDLTVKVTYSGDAKYMNASKSTNVNVYARKDVNLTAGATNINVGDVAVIDITINKDATGKVTVNGDEVIISNGTVKYEIKDLTAGNYTYDVKFAGDKYFNADETSVAFKVSKLASEVKVTVGSAYNVGDSFTIAITNNTAAVVTINGNAYVIKDGKVDIDTTTLAAGSYTVVANITEGDKYLASSDTATFTISKVAAPAVVIDVESSVVEGTDLAVEVTVAGATGTVTINGEEKQLNNSKASAIIKNVTVGDLNINVVYSGDAKYLNASNSTTVNVFARKDAELAAVSADINVGEVAEISMTINKGVTGKLTVNGEEVTVVNGTAKYAVAGLTAGNYTFAVKFAGDMYFNADETIVTVKVSKVASSVKVTVGSAYNVGDSFTIAISNNTAAVVTINGQKYAVKDGKVDIDTTKLAAGSYAVVASIAEDDMFLASTDSSSFEVKKVETPAGENPFNFDDNKTVESKTPTYSIDLPEDATGTLTVTIGDKNYTAEVKDGKATVVINDMPAGSYDVAITYSGDDKYSPIVKTSKATVKVDPKIVAKDAKVQYTAGKYYSVTVYGADGKTAPKGTQVIFTLNGKQVAKTTTDAKGVAKFKVTQTPVTNAKIVAKALGVSVTKKTYNHSRSNTQNNFR